MFHGYRLRHNPKLKSLLKKVVRRMRGRKRLLRGHRRGKR